MIEQRTSLLHLVSFTHRPISLIIIPIHLLLIVCSMTVEYHGSLSAGLFIFLIKVKRSKGRLKLHDTGGHAGTNPTEIEYGRFSKVSMIRF
jgi:hypothetical protein